MHLLRKRHTLFEHYSWIFLLLHLLPRVATARHEVAKSSHSHFHLRPRVANTPLIITNQCGDTIYPATLTQSGTGPGTGGFRLDSGSSQTFSVSENWQGRVWGRTNCTFNAQGRGQCITGDCGQILNCFGTVRQAMLAALGYACAHGF